VHEQTTALPDHLAPVTAGHRAFRRDTARFIQALGRLDPRDDETVAALQAWFVAAVEALHHHHTIEDEIMWPALRERSPAFAVADPVMQAQHEALDAALTAATAAVTQLAAAPAGQREAARRHAEEQVVRLRAILVEHLADEEATALPLLGEAFTVEEHTALAARVHDLFSPTELAFGLCWYLDAATPREREVILSDLPLPVRLLQRLVLRRRYERLSAVLDGGDEHRGDRTRRISTSAAVEVAASPDEVWELVSDLSRYAEWVHGTLEVVDADPVAIVGARYTERNRVLGPISARSEWRIEVLDRMRGEQRHVTEGVPGVRDFAVTVRIAPAASGTRVELQLSGDVRAGIATGGLARVMQRSITPSNERTVRALAGLVTREVAARPSGGSTATSAP
jgi:carbon monoxide dehydrogenase subunit G/iron-sulfur cluster repair protein YtfE (RIC family)